MYRSIAASLDSQVQTFLIQSKIDVLLVKLLFANGLASNMTVNHGNCLRSDVLASVSLPFFSLASNAFLDDLAWATTLSSLQSPVVTRKVAADDSGVR